MRAKWLIAGALIVLALLYLNSKARDQAVTSPLLGTRIDLNPALYSYPGVSSVPA